MPRNAGLPVPGYVDQSSDAVKTVAENKEMEERILRAIDRLFQDEAVDKRWLEIGKTHIEQGFMAMNRAVFKPTRIALPDDANAPVDASQ